MKGVYYKQVVKYTLQQQTKEVIKMPNKIKARREEMNMSQEELAIRSGVSRPIISNLETDKECNTTTRVLKSLADALESSVEDLFF